MWEDNKRGIGKTLLLVLLAVLLIMGLLVAYKFVSAQNEAHDAELLEVYQQHQQEQTIAKETNYAEVEAAYQADLDCIQKYMPGIVCWGDMLTGGSAGGVAYTDVLQTMIDENICDKYDFKTTLDNASQITRIDWDDYEVEIPVVNMGVGEEDTNTILGRIGVLPYVVSEDFEIPADCEPVEISFTLSNGKDVTPLTQGDGGINPVVINGVEGKLSFDLDYYQLYRQRKYSFVRSASGSPVPVQAGAEIKTAAGGKYREYIPVIWIGTYGGYVDNQELISQIHSIIDQHSTDGRYIILGVCTVSDNYSHYISSQNFYFSYVPDSSERFEKTEAALVQEFGNHFVNVRKYLMSDGLSDAEIKETTEDTNNISKGLVPKSFLSSANETELNAKAYQLIGKIVYDRMDKLGYFEEIKDELGITAIEKMEKIAAASANTKPGTK